MTRQEYLTRRDVVRQEGSAAYRLGHTRRCCPYSVFSINRQHWFYGWQFGKDLEKLLQLILEKEKHETELLKQQYAREHPARKTALETN